MARPKKKKEVTSDEVSTLLAELNAASDSPTPLGVKLDLPEEVKADLAGAPNAPIQAREELPQDKTFDPNSPTQINAWERVVSALGDVKVTESEKTIYLKSALNDVPLRLKIQLDSMGVSVDIASLNNFQTDVIFKALAMDEVDKVIVGVESFASRLQYYAALMQIEKFNGNAFPFVTLDKSKSIQDNASILRQGSDKVMGDISPPRWQVMLIALRIFETKQNILNTALLNKDFWSPVSSD